MIKGKIQMEEFIREANDSEIFLTRHGSWLVNKIIFHFILPD